MMVEKIELLQRKLDRAIQGRKQAETILESKALELFKANSSLTKLNADLENKVKLRTLELQESAKKYINIVEQSSDYIFNLDKDGYFTFINQPGLHKIGFTKEEIIGKHFIDYVRADKKEEVLKYYLDIRENSIPNSYLEIPVIDRSGKVLWIGQNVKLLKNEEGISFAAVARDITERKENDEKYKSIFENMNLGVLEVDKNRIITKAYPLFCKMLGFHESELLGMSSAKLLYKQSRDIQLELEADNSQELKATEIQLRRKDGTLIWVLFSGAPFYDREGEDQGRIGIYFDLTPQKNLEKALKDQRTKAENAEKAEKIFLANMSHEIRTPLNAIVGMTHLLNSTPLNSEQQDLTDVLLSSATILQNLISDILDISKIDSGKLEIRNKLFNLTSLIRSIEKTFTVKIDSRPLSVMVDIDDRLQKMLIGDPILISQVLLNLVGNAEKFTKEGFIYIRAIVQDRIANKVVIRFEVEDTGIGIHEKKLGIIFEQFRQADSRMESKFGGTGLGLAITKKIVELLNGEIHVVSKEGIGSKFTILLEFEESNSAITEEKQSEIYVNQDIVLQYPILVVEDNKMNQKYISKLLDRWNIEYEIAQDGREAVDLVSIKKFSLVFMDLQMPVMDGYEATRIIRQMPEVDSNLPIIALTASTLSSRKDEALKQGMSHFLAKPFSPNQLLETIDKYKDSNTIPMASKENVEQKELSVDRKSSIIQDSSLDQIEENYEETNPLVSDEFTSNTISEKNSNIVIDESILLENYGDDLEYAKEMFQLFVDNTPRELDNLEKSERLSTVKNVVHKIKPTFKMVGLPMLSNACAEIENYATDSNHEALNMHLDIFLNNAKKAVELVEKRYQAMILNKTI